MDVVDLIVAVAVVIEEVAAAEVVHPVALPVRATSAARPVTCPTNVRRAPLCQVGGRGLNSYILTENEGMIGNSFYQWD